MPLQIPTQKLVGQCNVALLWYGAVEPHRTDRAWSWSSGRGTLGACVCENERERSWSLSHDEVPTTQTGHCSRGLTSHVIVIVIVIVIVTYPSTGRRRGDHVGLSAL